jgi:hypothetical protein
MHNILKWGPGIVAGGLDLMLGGSGKGGWKHGRKFGDWITREIEWGEKAKWFLKSGRRRSLDFALGGGGGFSGGLDELIAAQQRGKAPPLQISYTPELQEQWEDASEAMVETSRNGWYIYKRYSRRTRFKTSWNSYSAFCSNRTYNGSSK